jgi:hypothetical protein
MAPLDYGPVLLRKPFGSRLAADTLPSGCPCGQNPTVGASPWLCPSFPTSCPCRVLHGRAPQPTRHYPRLWIHRPSSGRPRDLNPPDQDAAQHTVRACPPPRVARPVPRGRPVGSHALPPPGVSRVASDPLCRHAVAITPVGSLDQIVRNEGLSTPRYSPATAAFPVSVAGRLPHYPFRGLLGVHSRYGLPARGVARSDPFHRRLRQYRYLHCRSDCYRLERQLPGGNCTH